MADFLEMQLRIPMRVQRPILVIRSSQGELDDTWTTFLDKLSEGPVKYVSMPIPEVPRQLEEVYGADPMGQAEKENEAFSNLYTRVYNAARFMIQDNDPGMLNEYQVVVEPWRDSRITLLVMQMLRGRIGKDALLMNSFTFQGANMPNTKLPLLDPSSSYHAGRKLHDVEYTQTQGFNKGRAPGTGPLAQGLETAIAALEKNQQEVLVGE